jgi:exodeoxyribonuclease III
VIIATWNINSVRARKERLLAWLEQRRPDVLCLQETKVVDAEFPALDLEKVGYRAVCFGQKTYNGVAILSRHEIAEVSFGLGDGVDDPQCRLLSARIAGVRVVSAYVPNGGEVDSDKYAYKLAWLSRLRAWLGRVSAASEPLALCGDFNVAPRDEDVADPQAWQQSVLCHPTARQALVEVMAWGLGDVFAAKHPEGGVYSWWDYRMLAFPRNQGLRLDLILATACLAARCDEAWIDREARKGKQPSDHAPVLASFGPCP